MSNNKQTMKLYTEEQVDKIALQVKNYGYWDNRELTIIELPSDEEIDTASLMISKDRKEFLMGAKYVINKIQGGNE